MLENLTERFKKVFETLSGKKKLSESNLTEGIREMQLALLEANVSLIAVKGLIENIKKKAIGTGILKSVSPAAMFIKVVHESLVEMLGGAQTDDETLSNSTHRFSDDNLYAYPNRQSRVRLLEPTKISSVLVSGLQGAGKTTTVAKLASHYKSKRDVMTVSLDIHRPAAGEQLKILTEELDLTYYDREEEKNIKRIVRNAFKYAKRQVKNLIFFDTAGRTHVDEKMLAELNIAFKEINPCENIFVCDAMLGQEALTVARAFQSATRLDSLIFTKLDADTRGGAILSVKSVLDVPISFIGVGEKTDDLDVFEPQRMADRILDRGDIVSLVNKVQKNFDEEQTQNVTERLQKGEFDLQDFFDQIGQIKKMGSIKSMLKLMPGMSDVADKANIDENEFLRMTVLIQSMTKEERRKPFMLNGSRKKRIANGAGSNVIAVNNLLKKYAEMKKMFKKMKNPNQAKKFLNQRFGEGFAEPEQLEKLQKMLKK